MKSGGFFGVLEGREGQEGHPVLGCGLLRLLRASGICVGISQ